MYLNGDYGQNRNVNFAGTATTNLSTWEGIAGAFHWQATSKWAFTPRIEWMDDQNGFTTGTPQNIREFTLTGEYKMLEGLEWRAEYRHDWSNAKVFLNGTDGGLCTAPAGTIPFSACGVGNSFSQDTATIALVAFFGPKR